MSKKSPFYKHPLFHQGLLILFTSIVVTLLMSNVYSIELQSKSSIAGEIARRTIISPIDLSFEDVKKSELMRNQEEVRVSPIFIFKDNSSAEITKKFDKLFLILNKSGKRAKISKELRVEIENHLGVNFSERDWQILGDKNYRKELKLAFQSVSKPVFERKIVKNKKKIEKAIRNGVWIVLQKESDGKKLTLNSIEGMIDVSEAMGVFENLLSNYSSLKSTEAKSFVKKLSTALVQPTILFDEKETQQEIDKARNSIPPQLLRVKEGEVIVRAGDVISSSSALKIAELQKKDNNLRSSIIGHGALAFFLLYVLAIFFRKLIPDQNMKTRDIALISASLIASFIFVKVADHFTSGSDYLPTAELLLAMPMAVGGLLLQSMIGGIAVFLFTSSLALLIGLFLKDIGIFLFLAIVGNLVGALVVKAENKRGIFLLAGFNVASVNAILVFIIFIFVESAPLESVVVKMLMAIVGGIFSGIIASGSIPIFETLGGYITDVRLQELASLDRPLLKDLAIQTPGTWSHSVTVAQLGEVAANSIGANGLLVRVGAFYHDIGKMKKPLYFSENQASSKNPHDKLTPSMSALVIQAHVKDGVEMAKQHKLPKPIIDFIEQHHGTSLIEFFFNKAKEESTEEEVDESRYKYPGPKPQNKESGVLMLADGIEAASRSMVEPTPAKLQGLVQKMINKIFASGELEQTELTLKDLHSIARDFTRSLTSLYHKRVQYQQPADKTTEKTLEGENKETNVNSRSQTERRNKEGSNSDKNSEKDGKESIKRLGIS